MKYINAFVLSTLFLTSTPTLSDRVPTNEILSSITPESQGGFSLCSAVVNNFEEIIDEAFAIARQTDSLAFLYEIRIPLQKPVSTCLLKEQKVVSIFGLSNGNTEMLEYTPCGYKKPEIYASPFLGDYILEWPLPMTLARAIELKNAAGFNQPFSAITIRNPLYYPSEMHPVFIFVVGYGVFVFVDSVSGRVYTVDGHDAQTLGSRKCTLLSIPGFGVMQVCGTSIKPIFNDF